MVISEGASYLLPNGVRVEVQASDLPGLRYRLRGPGGWAWWAIDVEGRIVSLALTAKCRIRALTSWRVDDLQEVEVTK